MLWSMSEVSLNNLDLIREVDKCNKTCEARQKTHYISKIFHMCKFFVFDAAPFAEKVYSISD